jgi:hypothetical protein
MNRTYFLLVTLIASIVFTAYGQDSVEQKVQQLKDTWYEKINELSELGKKIDGKNEFIILIQKNIRTFIEENIKKYNEDERIEFYKTYKIMVKNFYKKFFQVIQNNTNAKEFLMQELLVNKDDFFANSRSDSKTNGSCCSGAIDRIKLALMQIIIEGNILKKYIDDYKECLQKIAEIERDIKLLGQPPLLVD